MNTLKSFCKNRSSALGSGRLNQLNWDRFRGLGWVAMSCYLVQGLV